MATDTMNPTGPLAGPSFRGLGYSQPVVRLESGDFIVSCIKLCGWALMAILLPTGLGLVGLMALNWMNDDPAFYTGQMYHGWSLLALAGGIVAAILLWVVVTGVVLFWAFLGMASAFQSPEAGGEA